MTANNSSPNPKTHSIVVGIDFGTTYSAAAFAVTTSPDHIELIRGWPTKGALVGTQVPTEIAYEEGDTSAYSWGYDITPKQKRVRSSLPSNYPRLTIV
jgi:molecular chaperone DnaK (HSP70)